eukprot:993898-Prorocentrum_minimum.AAC.2
MAGTHVLHELPVDVPPGVPEAGAAHAKPRRRDGKVAGAAHLPRGRRVNTSARRGCPGKSHPGS